jgi:hypothetical protein
MNGFQLLDVVFILTLYNGLKPVNICPIKRKKNLLRKVYL